MAGSMSSKNSMAGWNWTLLSGGCWRCRRASELAAAEPYPDFGNWTRSTGERVQLFPKLGWQSIDLRKDIQAHWAATKTWQTPPVVIDGGLMGSAARWRLMEGHTRIGLLGGLVKYGVLNADTQHSVWCGVPRTNGVKQQSGRSP